MSCLRYLTAFLLAASLSVQAQDPGDDPDAGRDPNAVRAVPWSGPPVRIIAGLNLGLRKIMLLMHGEEGTTPYCELAFRVNDQTNLMKDLFRAFILPERLMFVGKFEVDSDGNKWTEYRFLNAKKAGVIVCHGVKAMGAETIARVKQGRFAFDEKNLPYAIGILKDERSNLFFPVRDMLGFDDPRKALLEDVVPFEPGADLAGVVAYLVEKSAGADEAGLIKILERLETFPTRLLDPARATILNLRDQGTEKVREIARRVCGRHLIFSDGDLIKAVEELDAKDPKVVHAACVRLRDMGAKASHRALTPLKKLIAEKKDLEPETRKVAEAALAKMSDPAPPPDSRPSSH